MDAYVGPTPTPATATATVTATQTPGRVASPSWPVMPLSVADLEEFTRTQYKAFVGTGNPLHDTLFPPASNPTAADIAKGEARHRAALAAEPDHAVFVKVVDERTGEMAGAAKWCFYDRDAGRPDRVEVDWVEEADGGGEAREFAQRVMDEFHVLDLCFCNPAYERRGVASALVDFGCRRADEMGVRAFTEASVRGQPVYARKGFVSTEHIRLTYDDEAGRGRGAVVWYHMEREPGAAKGSTLA